MNLEQIIAELKDEGEKIRLAIEALESLAGVKAKKLREYRDTPKTVECTDCGKAFTFHGLTVHRAKHHGTKGMRNIPAAVTKAKAKARAEAQKLEPVRPGDVRCPQPKCGRILMASGLEIHLSRAHGIQSAHAKAKAKYYAKTGGYKQRDTEKPPTGPVRCIDCGEGPFDMAALDEHLKGCGAFILADRSNGKH